MAGNPSALGAWQSVHPAQCADWFSAVTAPWWIAGGWALDLYAGAQSRPHGDLDVGVLRRDAREIFAALSSWEVFEVRAGMLTRLEAGGAPRTEVNTLWCRPTGASLWVIQLLYKAKDPRPRDQADFDHIAPRLDPGARAWLRDAFARMNPSHAWVRDLSPMSDGK
jgi:hypothetical protein